MRTSLTDIQQTESYLTGGLATGDALVFEARLLTDPVLKSNMGYQQKAYKLLRFFHLKLVREEVTEVDGLIFSSEDNKGFVKQIQSLFK